MVLFKQAWHWQPFLCLLFVCAGEGQAMASEAALELAFVYNFAKFTDWPARSAPGMGGAVTLCVAGGDADYGIALSGLAGHNVRGHPLRTRAISRPAEVAGCQVVFVPEGASHSAVEIAQAAQAAGALSVSDHERFLDSGGMIALVSSGNRLQFVVDQDAVLRAGLNLNAQVLKLARSVRKQSP